MSVLTNKHQVGKIVTKNYEELAQFVNTQQFQDLLSELYALPEEKRSSFVNNVILQHTELERRGIIIPDGISIDTSVFGDGRQELFCIRKRVMDMFFATITYWKNSSQ